jgi:ssDNA-binding Zn-finger/Zn-ribbon topoisomerase 1
LSDELRDPIPIRSIPIGMLRSFKSLIVENFRVASSIESDVLKRTVLDVPAAQARFAEDRGAEYDAHLHVWYVDGDIPIELAEYVPSILRSRDYTSEVVPSCPRCHSRMVLRFTNIAEDFWGCSNFPRCRGARSGDYDVAQKTNPHHKPPFSSSEPGDEASPELRVEQERLLAFVKQCLPNGPEMLRWLNFPRHRFDGKNAISMLKSREGCDKVDSLLRETFQIPFSG